MADKLLIFYIPTSSLNEASTLAEQLLEKRLIACANVVQAQSIYFWNSNLEKEPEWIMFAKTIPECKEKVEREVLSNHSYETPCIIILNAECNDQYYTWVKSQIELE